MNIHETIYETFLLLPSLVHLITAFLMVLALFQNNLLASYFFYTPAKQRDRGEILAFQEKTTVCLCGFLWGLLYTVYHQ